MDDLDRDSDIARDWRLLASSFDPEERHVRVWRSPLPCQSPRLDSASMKDPVASSAFAWQRAKRANARALLVTLIVGLVDFALIDPIKNAVLSVFLVLVGTMLVAHWRD